MIRNHISANSFRTLVRKLFKFSLHKRNINAETTVFPRIVSSLEWFPPLNSFRGNYSRKYGIDFVSLPKMWQDKTKSTKLLIPKPI